MLEETRKARLIDIIKEKGEVTVKELSEILGVTGTTIRKDLSDLESIGMVVRTHGGALLPSHTKVEWGFIQKSQQHVEEKSAIAKKALEFVKPGDSIILDSGTTTLAMAREIKRIKLLPLTIVTNNFFIATELVGTGVDLIVIGGIVRENSFSLIGAFAEENIKKIYADKAFVGATGFSKDGFMTPNVNEAKIKSLMISQSSESFVIVDSSKFERPSFAIYANLNQIDHVITDWKVSESAKTILVNAGVDLIVAKEDENDLKR
ncbi:DeoR/GlpR family DNA-binding transcription regulator [Athalassotoga saccharophila]|uniref:DeoR/GlpR family DNA-binding transcription regulator n=1 Tax=Athalassotoga saccharophila TaxID=1441386 RepID=UPI00137B0ECE|nr:DeoR/GlpR family DNA-binding transcription regulator [Athalassotoga saccharophila]BBJ27802.1 HTH-type transcriptional repressor GlcR [Athalassotoga saccharophila]